MVVELGAFDEVLRARFPGQILVGNCRASSNTLSCHMIFLCRFFTLLNPTANYRNKIDPEALVQDVDLSAFICVVICAVS